MTPDRLLAASRLLRAHGVNAVRELGSPVALASADELTVWEYVPNDPTAPYPARSVGVMLARLHAVPLHLAERALGGAVPSLSAAAARGRDRAAALSGCASLPSVPGLDLRTLPVRFDEVLAAFSAACEASPVVLLHGDVNPGNVLWGTHAEPVLCDFEAVTSGPWAWDLVNAQVAVARGLQPAEDFAELVCGYGRDPASCEGWAELCRLRAFNIVTWHCVEAAGGRGDVREATELMAWLSRGFPGLPA